MTHMSNQNGGDQQWCLRIGKKVEKPNQVYFLSRLSVAVVPSHEMDQSKASH